MDISERAEWLFNYALEDLGYWWRSKTSSHPAAPFLIYSTIGIGTAVVLMVVFRKRLGLVEDES